MRVERTNGVDDAQVIVGFRSIPADVYQNDSVWAPESETAVDDCLEQAAAGAITIEAAVAIEDGRPLARAMAILDGDSDVSRSREGRIGLFECVPDAPEAGVAVLEHCRQWLRSLGARRVIAPRLDQLRAGLQISGFDQPQTIYTAHNPAFYADVFQDAGFAVATRMVSFIFSKDRAPSFRGVGKGAFSVRCADTANLDEELARVETFQANMFGGRIGYLPRDEPAARRAVERMLPLLDPDLVIIAEGADGETIGVLICIPDAWQPGESTDRARLVSIGVSPGWQGRRVAMSMGAQLTMTLIAKGYETLEGSWVMRDNHRPQLLAKLLGARPGREFALFSSDL